MSKEAEDAPALAGWAQNLNAPVDQRLAAAKQALDFYVECSDRLEDLLAEMEDAANNPTDDNVVMGPGYRVAAAKLRAILAGES